jgi:hypothetical protein
MNCVWSLAASAVLRYPEIAVDAAEVPTSTDTRGTIWRCTPTPNSSCIRGCSSRNMLGVELGRIGVRRSKAGC